MKLVYTGPHTAVDVPAAGLVDVPRGDPVEIPDDIKVVVSQDKDGEDVVVSLAASLLEQSTWSKAPGPKAPATAKGSED